MDCAGNPRVIFLHAIAWPSTAFGAPQGSLRAAKLSRVCGATSKRCQIRPIVDLDNPDFSAIDARDQRVALSGTCSNVATRTSSTLSGPIDGGRPGRGTSTTPSRRLSMNRRRHLATVLSCTRRSDATFLLVAPVLAQANTIRARNANDCDDFARRDHRVSWSRSSIRENQVGLGSAGALSVAQSGQPVLGEPSPPRVRHRPRHADMAPRPRRPTPRAPSRPIRSAREAQTATHPLTTPPAAHARHRSTPTRRPREPVVPCSQSAHLLRQVTARHARGPLTNRHQPCDGTPTQLPAAACAGGWRVVSS